MGNGDDFRSLGQPRREAGHSLRCG